MVSMVFSHKDMINKCVANSIGYIWTPTKSGFPLLQPDKLDLLLFFCEKYIKTMKFPHHFYLESVRYLASSTIFKFYQ